MMDQPVNENRAHLRARPAPELRVVPRVPPSPALTPGQIQALADLRAKAAELRVALGLPPGAAIPSGPLTDLLFQSRTR